MPRTSRAGAPSSPAPSAALVVSALAVGALAAPAVLFGQVGSTTDIVTGRVVGAGSQPVAGAQVTVTSLETGVSRSRTTNDKGSYTVLFPDGGGRYRIVVRAIGQQPRTATVQREGDEDRLVANVSLSQSTTTLGPVRVTARAPAGGGQNREPGNTERTVTTEQALRLPVDATDPNALASITPGVISQAGNDTTQAGFSVAGQRASQNNVTLDGVTFGGASFPQEAVRSTRVITNTFDVARGQFSGGQVSSTTRAGTNALYVGSTYTLRSPTLQATPSYTGAYGQGYTSNQLSAGVGGAFKKDKAFYFVALQGSRRTDPLASLLGADPTVLAGLGASSDSVARFLGALSAAGIPATVSGIPANRLNQQATGITRLDFNLSEANTLTLRGDFRYQDQEASRISPFAVPANGGKNSTKGGGLFASLSSRFSQEVFGGSLLNEARVYATGETRAASPYVDIPGGRVRLTSTLPDNSTGLSLLSYGANAGLPSDGQTNYVETTDELSLLSAGGAHRIKLGGLLNASRYDQQTAINPYGTYTYNTLEDFLANTPALFQRTLQAPNTRGGAVNLAAYLGDTWRRSRAFQLTYGARVEGSRYSGAPSYNAAVGQTFGLRTDRFPGEFRVSPRVGFTYTFFPDSAAVARQQAPQARAGATAAPSLFRGGPTLFVRGGIGEFRGRAPTQLFSAAQQGAGVGGQTQITCLNPLGPDYAAILAQGVNAIPAACEQRAGTAAFALPTAVPTVTAFAPDFRAPRSVRASLGVTRRFWERYTAGVDASYAWGVAQYGISDANLSTARGFTLAQEGNRPVFVPAASIIPTTGAAPLAASRLDPAFGQVLAVGSGLRSRNAQATMTFGGFTSKGANFNLSWTVARNRDQTSYAFGPPAFGFQQTPTAGNPNVLALAAADQDIRHNIIGTLTYPLGPSFEFTTITRVTSGVPYTPTVSGDVNGDGARNDAAFVFDPKAPGLDPALSAAMQRALDAAPARARACLESQLGRVAGRNSCRGPWTPNVDFQLNYKPDRFGLQRRLTISALLLNPLAGLNQLFHGANDLRGWGQFARPDQTLLAVRGFDPATQRYLYDVNERFGSTRGSTTAFRQTFQVGLQARYVYGQNPFGAFGFGGGGPGGGGPGGGGGGPLAGLLGGGAAGANGAGGATPSTALAASLNPAAKLIDLRDSLGLDSAQVRRLEPVRDSLAARYQRFRTDLRAKVAKLGANPDPAVIFSTIRPDLARGRQLLEEAVQQSQAILTPAQWAKVGDDVKNPFRRAFGGGPGGGRPPQ